MLCLCAAQLKFWFQTDLGRENSASCYRQGRQLLLTFLAMFTRWSRSTSNFCALIGQNLTGEFMGKIYAASWNLFTLTAEAERVLCQPVMFLIVFFIGFWLRNASLVKVGNPISDDIVFVFHRSWCVRGLKSLERFWPYLIAFRSSIRNGKPE